MLIGQVSDDWSGLGWPGYKLVMVFQSGIRQDTMQEATSTLCYIERAFVATSNANNSLSSSSSIVCSAMELQSQSDQFLSIFTTSDSHWKPMAMTQRSKTRHTNSRNRHLLSSAFLNLTGFGFSAELRVGCSPHTLVCKPSLVDQSLPS